MRILHCAAAAVVIAMSPAAGAEPQLAFCGVQRAVVDRIDDPAGRGRISIVAPALGGDAARWAERNLTARNRAPSRAEPGDQVWVMFEGCDAERPIVLGFVPQG